MKRALLGLFVAGLLTIPVFGTIELLIGVNVVTGGIGLLTAGALSTIFVPTKNGTRKEPTK